MKNINMGPKKIDVYPKDANVMVDLIELVIELMIMMVSPLYKRYLKITVIQDMIEKAEIHKKNIHNKRVQLQ